MNDPKTAIQNKPAAHNAAIQNAFAETTLRRRALGLVEVVPQWARERPRQ